MAIPTGNIFRVIAAQGAQHISKGRHIQTSSIVHADRMDTLQMNDRIKCTLIPGDGIGPELLNSVEEIFKAAEVPIDFETVLFSEMDPEKNSPFKDVVSSIMKNKICLKGCTVSKTDTSETGTLESLNLKMRRKLDLYANVLHAKPLPNIKCKHEKVDCIIIREQTEGEYSSLEHECVPGVVECLKIITANKSKRIAKFAFDYAVKFRRKKLTVVHKANIMKLGDGLFLRSCTQMSKFYPRIKFENMIVDNCTMQMVSNPEQFDVLVTPNLYGNILINIVSGLVGGAGIVPGVNYSDRCAVFEQGTRHAFQEAAGKNIANPTAVLRASVYLLNHVNLICHSKLIKHALNNWTGSHFPPKRRRDERCRFVLKVLADGKVRTKDLGGQSSTKEFTNAIISNLSE